MSVLGTPVLLVSSAGAPVHAPGLPPRRHGPRPHPGEDPATVWQSRAHCRAGSTRPEKAVALATPALTFSPGHTVRAFGPIRLFPGRYSDLRVVKSTPSFYSKGLSTRSR